MDLVDWDEGVFLRIAKEVQAFVDSQPHPVPVHAIPMSALLGDNVVDGSAHTPWYDGPPLLAFLEQIRAPAGDNLPGARVRIHRVIRPQGGEHGDFHGYAGVVAAGTLTVGEPMKVLPSGRTSTIATRSAGARPCTRRTPATRSWWSWPTMSMSLAATCWWPATPCSRRRLRRTSSRTCAG